MEMEWGERCKKCVEVVARLARWYSSDERYDERREDWYWTCKG
jgi:hypothetical protein